MRSVNSRLQKILAQSGNTYAQPLARRIILGAAFFAIFMIVLSTDFFPDKVSLQVGQVSDSDIIAPRTISYVDVTKTKKLEMEVLASVANVYDLDVAVMANAEENVGLIFQAARTLLTDKTNMLDEQKTEKLQEVSLPVSLPSATISGLAAQDGNSLNKLEEDTKNLLRKYLQRGIREDDLDLARKQVVLEAEELGLNKSGEAVVAGIAQTLLRPNFILNVHETDRRKQMALATIEPVRETAKTGQMLVRKGDVVTGEQIQVMQELGLYASHYSKLRVFGLGIFLFVLLTLLMCYLYKYFPQSFANDRHFALLGLVLLLSLLLAKTAHYYSDFAAPVAAGALLAGILLDTRIGIMVAVILALLFGVIVDNDWRVLASILSGSLAGVYSVAKMTHGYSLTKAGVWIAVVNSLVIAATGFVSQVGNAQLLVQIVAGIVGGIAAAVITTGILPYLENAFGVTTPIKLLDLARPNHPLLQRLLLDAPGTYHHSVLVGNLAETAAHVINADPVTARVGAYYHDIGKIKRPYFFIENQSGTENPHDKIAPSLSTLIITSHIRDGEELCNDYKLPQVITDIVRQHHGTMLASYFYKRATENERSDCLIEADFRYEGPCPQSKEAALIMLADACEAAVRSLNKPNVNRIEAMVRRIIRERLQDGQLDDCNVTLKDLKTIGDVYIRLLSSMFHNRIEYPDSIKELERKKNKNGNSHKQPSEREENSTVADLVSDSANGVGSGGNGI